MSTTSPGAHGYPKQFGSHRPSRGRSLLRAAGHGIGGALVGLLSGCHPGTIDTLSDSELVATRFDPDVFGVDGTESGGFRTYARPDVVATVPPPDPDDPEEPDPPEFNDAILGAIDRNMEALGYERIVDAPGEADLYLFAAAIEERRQIWSCWPAWGTWGWWGGWPGPVGPGMGWCFPGPTTATFSIGTVLIDLVDPSTYDEDTEEYLVVWSAGANGLLSRSTSGIEAQIDRTIDQAFRQSDYLRVPSEP